MNMSSEDTPAPSKQHYQTSQWFLSPIATRFNLPDGPSTSSSISPTPTYPTSQVSPDIPTDTSEDVFLSAQACICSVRCSQWQEADKILSPIQDDFLSLGEFLVTIFYNHP